MFRKLIMIAIAGTCMTQIDSAQAGSAGQSGFLGGAAGGAILGQAIGRDTEGTLLGTAIGGALGYIVGNEMDKQAEPAPRVVYTRLPPETYSAPLQRAPRYADEQVCRPAEILATIDGHPERVNTVACLEGDEWVIQGAAGSSFTRTMVIERDDFDFYRGNGPSHFYDRHGKHGRNCKKHKGNGHYWNGHPSFASHENVRIIIH